MRKIESVYAPHETHWVGNGFRVHNFIPSGFGLDMKRMDPFILLDYNAKMSVSPSDTARGVGAHSHRGFETITIAYEGKVEHHDSFGGGGVIGTGDVQWMSAARGVLHKEFYESGFNKTGGDFCIVQLWVNLASKFKMSEPKYQAITNDKMGVYDLGGGGRIEVIAGEYEAVKGAARTYLPVHLMNAKLKSDQSAKFSFKEHFNTALLVVKGAVIVNENESVSQDNLALFENKGKDFNIRALEDSVVLVMSGEPLNEPIAQYGPFVMNTKEELNQAFVDFERGEFGRLE